MPGDRIRMIYGFALLAVLAWLAYAIAKGMIEEKTSYGLMPLIVAISSLATTFANWAFSGRREPVKPTEPTEPEQQR